MGEHWTDVEVAQLRDVGPAEFARTTDRSWHACRFKYARLMRKQPDPPAEPITSPKPEASDEDWEALFAPLEQAEEARATLSPTEETAEITAPDDKPFGICFLGDVHAGAQGVQYAQLKRDLETIRDTDGLYVIGMGDYIENTKVQLKSATALYTSLFASAREQIAYIRLRFKIAHGKWLVLAQGNHDAFDYRGAGIDRLPGLAQELDCPYFSEKGGTIYLTVGGQRYVIVVKHDYRGKSQINKSNSQRRLFDEWPWSWESADVICLAHLHEPSIDQPLRRGRRVVWMRSGTYKTHDPWAESGGYCPSYGLPLVVFFPNERKIVPFADFEEGVRYLDLVRGD